MNDALKNEALASFSTKSRIHMGLSVADLSRSVDFYRILLGVEPSKVRPAYAKFEPEEPSVNLTLNESPSAPRSQGTHYGIQVKSTAEVREMAARLSEAGLSVRMQEETTCCYAVQDKAWVADPDGNPWEVFVVLEHADHARVESTSNSSPGATQCC